jgi:hypothetical protein
MKREAVYHSKMRRLCRRLDIPQWQGVGLLESIWHLTARETDLDAFLANCPTGGGAVSPTS